MPCWPRGVERSPGCDAAGGPATHQANAERRHGTTAARRDLDIGGWRCGRASDGDGFWRDWGAWPSYQFRMAFVVVGDDVPAIWKHADAAGGGQVAAQSTFGEGERKLSIASVPAGRIYQSIQRKRSLGCAHYFRPTYAEANVGHPSDSSNDAMTSEERGRCGAGFCCTVETATWHSEFCYASALHKSEGMSCQRALIKSFSWAM
jgi:hypothetical protein